MNEQVANILRTLFVDLDWVDKASGLVRAVRTSSSTGQTKVFPAAANVSPDYDPQVMTDMVPDSTKYSVLYFEDQGINYRNAGRFVECTSRVRMVVWLNGSKLRFTSSQAVKSIQQIVQSLPTNYSVDDFGQIKITVEEEPKSAAIFSQYSYNEEQTQYLFYPNDYFSLLITTRFNVSRSCFDDYDPVFLDECGDDTDFDYCTHFEESLSDRQLACITISLIDGNTFEENEQYGVLVAENV